MNKTNKEAGLINYDHLDKECELVNDVKYQKGRQVGGDLNNKEIFGSLNISQSQFQSANSAARDHTSGGSDQNSLFTKVFQQKFDELRNRIPVSDGSSRQHAITMKMLLKKAIDDMNEDEVNELLPAHDSAKKMIEAQETNDN